MYIQMYILRLCLSNSPRQIPSEGRFLLATGYWSLATVFIAILLSSGCADETINDPISENPVEDSNREEIVSTTANYFPMTVGSRWVYRNPDGSEWSREVTETEEVGTRNYHLFNYDPPIEDNQFPFFRAPMYITFGAS